MVMIVSDVGGTNVRFARADAFDGPLQDVLHMRCADFASIEDAFSAYLSEIGYAGPVDAMSIAVAAPVTTDVIDVTNNHWVFSKTDLRSRLAVSRLMVINDFTAQALAQTDPTAHGNKTIIPGVAVPDAPVLIIGPGTGLGVSGLMATAAGPLPLEGEGGHAGFAAQSEEEAMLQTFIRREQGCVFAEHAVSGGGLERLYRFITRDHADVPDMTAPQIGARAIDEPGPCRDAVIMMLNILGTVIADTALTMGAWGGVVVTGGIVPKVAPLIDASQMATRIHDAGGAHPLLAHLPVWLSVDPNAGVRGALAGLSCEFLTARRMLV